MTGLGNTTAAAIVMVAAAVFFSGEAGAAAPLAASPPTGAVGGVRNPASGTLQLSIYASDAGWGLANAEARLGGASAFARLGTGACPEHPAVDGPEPPSGACPASVSGVPLALDTRSLADGSHELRVRVTNAAANTATILERNIVVQNARPTNTGPIATLMIGISSVPTGSPSGSSSPPRPPEGPFRCRRPKLRMHLARKPLWRTHPHHVPVLRYRRRYPFRGRLTCLNSSHHRVSAPKGTRVGVFYRVWRRSFKHPWGPVRKLRRATLVVRKGGRLRIRIGFRSGRTLIFRYNGGPSGEFAKAKLRLAVPPRSRKPPWGPR